MKTTFIALCAALLCASAAVAQDASSPPVNSFRGVGINVTDMGNSLKFYEDVFGFKVAKMFPDNAAPKDAREVVLNTTGRFDLNDAQSGGITLAHLNDKPLPDGRTAFGRMMVVTTNLAALAARAQSAGATVTKSRYPQLIFMTDPDGYRIEIFQPVP